MPVSPSARDSTPSPGSGMATSKPYTSAHPHFSLLSDLAEAVEALRKQQKLTRRQLAERSGVSERFIADVERVAANPSLLSLAQLADALDTSVASLLTEAGVVVPDLARLVRDMKEADQHALADSLARKQNKKAKRSRAGTLRSVALVGLRGAGKTTVGELLAKELDCPFIELDQQIEATAELPLAQIFEIHGEAYYRRLEREAVLAVLTRDTRCVLATGGGLVTNDPAWAEVRERCITVWLRAKPREHLMRVLRQGDRRPMERRPHALSELESLLASREPAYRQAEWSIETTGLEPAAVARRLVRWLSDPEIVRSIRRPRTRAGRSPDRD